MILGAICSLLGLAGVIGIFAGLLPLVLIGALADIVENLVEYLSKRQNNPVTITLAAIAGLAFSVFTKTPIWRGIAYALCWESALMGIFSYGAMFLSMKK